MINVNVTYIKDGTQHCGIVQVSVITRANVEIAAMNQKRIGRSQIKSFIKAVCQPQS